MTVCSLFVLVELLAAQTPPEGPQTSATEPVHDPLNRDSPQSSAVSFLEACHARNYVRAWRYLDLRGLPEARRREEGPLIAQQLAEILDHDSQFDVAGLSRNRQGDEEDGLSKARERVASLNLNGQRYEIQMIHVTLRSGVAVWLFSAEAVALIPIASKAANTSIVEKYLPAPLVDWKLMDTQAWRWIALLLLLAALASLSGLILRLGLLVAEPVVRRLAPGATPVFLAAFGGPLQLLLGIAWFRIGVEWIHPAALLRLQLSRLTSVLFIGGTAWLAGVIVDLGMGRVRAVLEGRRQTLSYSALPLVSRILKLTIVMLAVTAVLSEWGYNTSTILAGLGVGGLAIALAAQKTIENLFGGVAVISDRPVFVGDVCRFGDRVGTVEDIGLRSTRLRTPDRTLVTIPNAQFSSMTLENFSKRDKMWFHITLNLRRDTSSEQVRNILKNITEILVNHAKVEEGRLPVRFIGVGTYSLDIEIFAYILTRNGDEFLQLQQELLLAILDAIAEEGAALAIPVQASIHYPVADPPAQNGYSDQQPGMRTEAR